MRGSRIKLEQYMPFHCPQQTAHFAWIRPKMTKPVSKLPTEKTSRKLLLLLYLKHANTGTIYGCHHQGSNHWCHGSLLHPSLLRVTKNVRCIITCNKKQPNDPNNYCNEGACATIVFHELQHRAPCGDHAQMSHRRRLLERNPPVWEPLVPAPPSR